MEGRFVSALCYRDLGCDLHRRQGCDELYHSLLLSRRPFHPSLPSPRLATPNDSGTSPRLASDYPTWPHADLWLCSADYRPALYLSFTRWLYYRLIGGLGAPHS